MIKKKVGIFVPVYHRDNKTKKSISSLLETEAKDIELYVYVGINGASPELIVYLEEIKQDFLIKGINYNVFKSKTNIGKPKIVNLMVECIAVEVDYIISFDSDMIVSDPDWIIKFIEIFETYTGDKKIGALCAQQTGNCCHVLDKDPYEIKVGKYTLRYRHGNEGSAGGVLMTHFTTWNMLNGYRAFSKYGSDDGHMALDLANNDLIMPVVLEIELFHPFEENLGYADWKVRSIRGELSQEEESGFKF